MDDGEASEEAAAGSQFSPSGMPFRLLLRIIWIAIASLSLASSAHAQKSPSEALLSMPARQWIVDAAAHEVAILQHADSYLRYRMHVVDQKGDQVREVIESRDGPVARLILRDGRALTADEDAAERQRLNAMIASPSAYANHMKHENSGKKLAAEIVMKMPDAMVYTYAPGQPQVGHDMGGGEIVIDYRPNPHWTPTSTTAEALTGLGGRMWIDAKTHVLLRMEGHIFKPVNFGWGVLAHIYPGGNLLLEQTDAGGQRWIYTHFTQEVSVRALMVKTLNVHTQVDASRFQTLARPMSYQEAIGQLLAMPLPAQ